MHRFLPLLVIATILSILNFTPLKTSLIYKLGLSGDPTSSCCLVEQIEGSKGDFDQEAKVAIFNSQVVDYPKVSLTQNYDFDNKVLGTTTNDKGEQKWIEVSLDQQKVRAWEGNKIVMEFPISSGLWFPTPKGDFTIWYKTRYQRMTGGSKELHTYYDLPNVPNNMFFYKGFALHGAYWHNNFGHPMSHGCVNEPLANAAAIFEWAGPVVPPGQSWVRAASDNPGTRVFVH